MNRPCPPQSNRWIFCIAIAISLMCGACATTGDLRKVESDSKTLVLQIEQDLNRSERELAIANLKYQNANDNEKSAIKAQISQIQSKISDLDRIAKDARDARQIAESLQQDRARQRDAFADALKRFKAAEDEFRAYQQQPRY